MFANSLGFGTVSKREQGNLIRNPAYDEEEFKTLPKEQQTRQRERSMMYLQGPNGSLQEERVVPHQFLEAHPPDFRRLRLLEPIRKLQSGSGGLSLAKLRQHYEEAFINLFNDYPPPGWMAGLAPAKKCFTYDLPAAVLADVMKAR